MVTVMVPRGLETRRNPGGVCFFRVQHSRSDSRSPAGSQDLVRLHPGTFHPFPCASGGWTRQRMPVDAGLLLDTQRTAPTPFSSLQGPVPALCCHGFRTLKGELCKSDAPHGADFPHSLWREDFWKGGHPWEGQLTLGPAALPGRAAYSLLFGLAGGR